MAQAPGGPKPRLGFDDETFRLAYDVFVANSNLPDAFKVAESAVRQSGSSFPWRKRLAQVAEWFNRPRVALAQWQWIARAANDAESWSEVRRLGLATSDGDALLESDQWFARQPGADPQLDLKIAQTLERQGNIEQAFAWLEERMRARGGADAQPLAQFTLALAERAGDDSRLLAMLQSLESTRGPDPERAVRVAKLLYERRQFVDAFSALKSAAAAATSPETFDADAERRIGFWAMYGALARALQNDDEALLGHRQMLMRDVVAPEHLEVLIGLLEPRSTAAALDVGEYAWRRYALPRSLERAFGLALESGDFRRAQALLEGLDPEQRRRFEDDSALLRLRAQYRQSVGDFPGARADLQKLLDRDLTDSELRAALVWLAIAARDAAGLRGMLLQWGTEAERQPALWGAFGAGWQALDEPQRALPFFHRQARRSNDYLWWLAYADALALVGHADASWSLRRRAWTELARANPATTSASADHQDRVVSLALSFSPGDGARALLTRLIRTRLSPAASDRRGGSQPEQARATDAAAIAATIAGVVGTPADADAIAADRPAALAGPLGGPGLLQLIEGALEASREALASSTQSAQPTAAAPVAYLPGRGFQLPRPELEDPVRASGREARFGRTAGTGDRRDARGLTDAAAREPEAASARELATAYLLSNESYDAARAWLLTRYANELARPTWARLTLALADRDRQALSGLLDTLPDWLPKLQSIEALQTVQRVAAAQTLAFETLDVRPASNEAHQRLIETVVGEASNVQAEASTGYQGPLDYQQSQVQLAWRFDERLTLGALAQVVRMRSSDDAQLVDAGHDERSVGGWARIRTEQGWWTLTATHRNALRTVNGLRLDWVRPFDGRWRTSAAVGLHQQATELPALRLGATRDLVEARTTYELSQREYVGAVAGATRLRTQSGLSLADGYGLSLEAGHRMRIDYPDLTLKAGLAYQGYRAGSSVDRDDPVVARLGPAGAADLTPMFVPQGSRQFTLAAAWGDSARTGLTKAIRPFAEAGVRHNDVTGTGWHLRAGAVGSLIGTDRLTLTINAISATPGNTRGSRDIALSYQWIF